MMGQDFSLSPTFLGWGAEDMYYFCMSFQITLTYAFHGLHLETVDEGNH